LESETGETRQGGFIADMSAQIKTTDELMKMVMAFRQSRTILTAFELGIFTALGEERKTSAQVACDLRADPRGTDRLMNALCVLGLIRKTGGLFSDSAFSSRYLIKGKPDYLAGLAHSAGLWNRWGTLTKAVRRGGAVLSGQGRISRASKKRRTQGFIAAMHHRGSAQAQSIVKLLDLSSVQKTLDVGAGSGAYSIALARAKGDILATVFDLPEVIPLTRSYVKKAGLPSRFNFLEGDLDKDPFGSGYDLVLLSAIIHMNSPVENAALFKKCARALSPGGQLVIQDWVMSADRTSPAAGALFALNMLINTEGGDTFTQSEIEKWMKMAGLRKIRHVETPSETSLMIGWKPGVKDQDQK
jgi:SAM-dependent methyltransferase